jgi:hypothetical protein
MAFGTGEVIPNPAGTLPLDPSTTGRVAVDLQKGVVQNGGRPSRSLRGDRSEEKRKIMTNDTRLPTRPILTHSVVHRMLALKNYQGS